MKCFKTILAGSMVSLFLLSPINAAEMEHSQHMKMQPKQTGKLSVFGTMSQSGTAREAGFDGKYTMESTTVRDDIMTQCAKASRGLVMVDNKTWAKCGGKPDGWAKGPVDKKSQTMDHSKHNMH